MTPAAEPLDVVVDLDRHLGPAEARWQPARPLIDDRGHNPLVYAVHLAFSEHRPLVLSPDAVWLTIAQGFAAHVRSNSEPLRHDLVNHDGKLTLQITRADLVRGAASNDWPSVNAAFAAQLRARNGALHDLVVCDFSTTGPAERIASEIVLMDVMRPYYDYCIKCICGIPTITLEGTPDDWARIEERARRLEHFGLGWWTERLVPICAALSRAARGDVDRGFFQRIYKLREDYGSLPINGWVAELFPFIVDDQSGEVIGRNPLFEGAGEVYSNDLPTGLSTVPFACRWGDETVDMELVGGLMGISQDPVTMALRPEIGWSVHEGHSIDALLRRLSARFGDTLAPPVSVERLKSIGYGRAIGNIGLPADLGRFYLTCNGLSLPASEPPQWRFLPAEQLGVVVGHDPAYANDRLGISMVRMWVRFCELGDGSFFAYGYNEGRSRDDARWRILHCTDKALLHGGEVAVVAWSFEEILSRALDETDASDTPTAGFAQLATIPVAHGGGPMERAWRR